MEKNKKPWQSKTILTNLLLAIFAVFWPGAAEFMGEHPEIVASAWGFINIVLRWVTKDGIQLLE